jgi:hypothetical protein
MRMRRRRKMTKRFHKCDDTCRINHKLKMNPPKADKIDKIIKKKIQVQPKKQKLSENKHVIVDIVDIVKRIDNENETDKVLEKTLINLRKLEKDIAN